MRSFATFFFTLLISGTALPSDNKCPVSPIIIAEHTATYSLVLNLIDKVECLQLAYVPRAHKTCSCCRKHKPLTMNELQARKNGCVCEAPKNWADLEEIEKLCHKWASQMINRFPQIKEKIEKNLTQLIVKIKLLREHKRKNRAINQDTHITPTLNGYEQAYGAL